METRAYKGPVPAGGAGGGAEPKQNKGEVCTESGGRALKRDSSPRAGARRRDRASAIQEAKTCVRQPEMVSDCNQGEGGVLWTNSESRSPRRVERAFMRRSILAWGDGSVRRASIWGELEVPDWRDW